MVVRWLRVLCGPPQAGYFRVQGRPVRVLRLLTPDFGAGYFWDGAAAMGAGGPPGCTKLVDGDLMNDQETKLREMVSEFRNSIVSKDAERLGALFAIDADFVNIAAMRWSGRAAITSNHAKMFAGPLQITMDVARVDVRFLREEVALVTASWKRDVAANASGPALPAGSGELTFVATRSTAGWLFASAQNTQAIALPGAPPPS